MSYITITDLPETQIDSVTGQEYILFTDTNGISKKFKVDTMVTYVGNNFDNTVDEKLLTKVDKIVNKGLSTEDFSTAEKEKLNSYCNNSESSYPLNYCGNIGESISCFLDINNNKIKIFTSDDKSSFTGKLIILYTKEI